MEALSKKQPIGLPTDTVYGLAADARYDDAVAHIYAWKQRPSFNPLIAHVYSREQAFQLGEFNDKARKLVDHFWYPSPQASALTIVVPRKSSAQISSLALAGLDTIALRLPDHPLALDLLAQYGAPLMAPSANRSGHLSPTTATHVRRAFPNLPVLDGGPCKVGVESTIVACVDDTIRLLRPGIVTTAMIEKTIGESVTMGIDGIKAPGMLKKHYAPSKPLRINATSAHSNEIMVGFGNVQSDLNLSNRGDLLEAASNLFKLLHQCDQTDAAGIAVAPIPNEGIGIAINDRLQRAAS